MNDSSTEYGSSDSHNIIIADLLFDTEEDPVAVARPIFVKCMNTSMLLNTTAFPL